MKKSVIFRKFLLLTLAIACFLAFLSLSACSKNSSETDEKAAEATAEDDNSYYVEYKGVKFTSGISEDEFKALLEKLPAEDAEYTLDEGISCMFSENGYDRTFTLSFATAFTFPLTKGENTLDEIYFTAIEAETEGGIGLGSTKDEVAAAFGEDYYMVGAKMTYNQEGGVEKAGEAAEIYFYLEEDMVTGIGLCANYYHVSE